MIDTEVHVAWNHFVQSEIYATEVDGWKKLGINILLLTILILHIYPEIRNRPQLH